MFTEDKDTNPCSSVIQREDWLLYKLSYLDSFSSEEKFQRKYISNPTDIPVMWGKLFTRSNIS
jgi:hypothetical protein